MNRCLVVILGGGRGARLHPLTKMRSNRVPLGGSYRLIDSPSATASTRAIERFSS
jgi:glucose-1-phosphate adenylyltransferase